MEMSWLRTLTLPVPDLRSEKPGVGHSAPAVTDEPLNLRQVVHRRLNEAAMYRPHDFPGDSWDMTDLQCKRVWVAVATLYGACPSPPASPSPSTKSSGPSGPERWGRSTARSDTRLDREVAIKVLPEHFADDEERLRRFEREAKSLASLNHPNVAQIHGVDQVDDTCFLVLELVPGGDARRSHRAWRAVRSTRRSTCAARSPRDSRPRTRPA